MFKLMDKEKTQFYSQKVCLTGPMQSIDILKITKISFISILVCTLYAVNA